MNDFIDALKFDFQSRNGLYYFWPFKYRYQNCIHLGEHAMVFQAEITFDLLEDEMTNHTIHFHIDSQGAMKRSILYNTQEHGRMQNCYRNSWSKAIRYI